MTGLPADPSGDRFGLVFLLLISSFVLDALVTSHEAQAAVLVAYLAALLLVLRVTGIRRGLFPVLNAAFSLVSLVFVAVALAAPGDLTAAALALWLAVILSATIAAIVRRVLHHPAVTMQEAPASAGQRAGGAESQS